jgi:hydrogenase maturation protease
VGRVGLEKLGQLWSKRAGCGLGRLLAHGKPTSDLCPSGRAGARLAPLNVHSPRVEDFWPCSTRPPGDSFEVVSPPKVIAGMGKVAFVVGYGNPLRHDDRVGQEVAHLLRALRDRHLAPELEDAQIYAVDQLLPEIVAELEGARLAVFVDAERCPPSGSTVSVRWLTPSADLATFSPAPWGNCWEDLTPEGLLGLGLLVYGAVPRAALVSLGVPDLGVGEGLSAVASSAVPEAASVVRKLLSRTGPVEELAYA